MVVGERSLGGMMKRISKEANLSRIYTNHSIRATAVTILDKSGFEVRHINNDCQLAQKWKFNQGLRQNRSNRQKENVRNVNCCRSWQLCSQWRLCEVRKPYSWKYQFVSSFNSLTARARFARFALSFPTNLVFLVTIVMFQIYWYFLSQPVFIQFFTYCLMLRLLVNRIMCRWIDLEIFTRLEINYQFHLLSWPFFFSFNV